MAEHIEGPGISGLRAGGTLAKYTLVRLDTGSLANSIATSEDTLGVIQRDAVEGDAVTVVPLHMYAAHIMVAVDAFAVGAEIYQAAAGKVDDSGTVKIGVALSASGADGDYVTVVTTGVTIDTDT